MSDEKRPIWDPDGVVPETDRMVLKWNLENIYPDRDDYRVLAYTQVLWCGWECDYAITLIEIEGRREVHVSAGVHHPSGEGPAAMLRERIQAYREAIASTEAFLEKLEASND